MPIDPGTGTVISAGIGAISNIAGGKQQAKAIKESTKIADRFNRDALNYEKDQVSAEQERLRPFRELGTSAYGQLGRMLGVEGAPAAGQSFTFARPSMAAPAGGPMVLIEAPDGSQARVPRQSVQKYVARGGRVLSGPPEPSGREDVRY